MQLHIEQQDIEDFKATHGDIRPLADAVIRLGSVIDTVIITDLEGRRHTGSAR